MFLYFFCIKNELVRRTSYIKGLRVRTKFLPVPDNRTEVSEELLMYNANIFTKNFTVKRKLSQLVIIVGYVLQSPVLVAVFWLLVAF